MIATDHSDMADPVPVPSVETLSIFADITQRSLFYWETVRDTPVGTSAPITHGLGETESADRILMAAGRTTLAHRTPVITETLLPLSLETDEWSVYRPRTISPTVTIYYLDRQQMRALEHHLDPDKYVFICAADAHPDAPAPNGALILYEKGHEPRQFR